MFLAAALVLGALAAPTQQHPRWTLGHARRVLAARVWNLTDTTQADTPAYELSISRRRTAALRALGSPQHGRWQRFRFAGTAYDERTDLDVAVRFTLSARGRVTEFEGPPADTTQPSFPIRAAFYYAWYPEAWWREGFFPYTLFHPTLWYYAANDASVINRQIDAMRYAHLEAGIYSWWGRDGYPPTDDRFWRYLGAARTTPFRWAIYYEPEGYRDPSVDEIRRDLGYIRAAYASQPAYLKVDGRFVVFVYGDSGDGCDTARRWRDANATIGADLVLKAFAGFRDCPAQPFAWHQYSGSRAEYDLAPDAFMVSPGFDEAREGAPRLGRDPSRWRADLADMVASQARWQLVISFNEWPEGTSVEDAREWQTPSGYGSYLDALNDALP